MVCVDWICSVFSVAFVFGGFMCFLTLHPFGVFLFMDWFWLSALLFFNLQHISVILILDFCTCFDLVSSLKLQHVSPDGDVLDRCCWCKQSV